MNYQLASNFHLVSWLNYVKGCYKGVGIAIRAYILAPLRRPTGLAPNGAIRRAGPEKCRVISMHPLQYL